MCFSHRLCISPSLSGPAMSFPFYFAFLKNSSGAKTWDQWCPFLFYFLFSFSLFFPESIKSQDWMAGQRTLFCLPGFFLWVTGMNVLILYTGFLFLRQDFTMRPWHSLGRLDRTWIEFRALPVSKSLMLGQNVCITIPGATFGPKLSPVPGFHK